MILTGDQSTMVANDKVTITSVVVNAKGSEIVAEKGATIKEVVANQEGAKISGTGTVSAVKASANDVVVSTPSTSVTAAQSTTGVMAGTSKVEAGKATTSGSSSSTSSGGGSSSGGNTNSTANVEILAKATLGLPTPEVKVKVDGNYENSFDLYFMVFSLVLPMSVFAATPVCASAAISNGNKTVTLNFNEGLVDNSADLKAAVTFAAMVLLAQVTQ